MYHKFIRIECIKCGTFHDVPIYCGDRFCPICSISRRGRIRSRLEFLVNSVKAGSGYSFKHLTLTIKNQNNLPTMVSTIMQCFRKLRQTDSWKFHVNGGAFVLEVTGKPSDWHVHLHIIIESRYYKWKDLLALWMRLSPGRGVWINDIPKSQIVGYLTKYISKTKVFPKDIDEVNKALKGTRLFQPFGSWFAINKTYEKPSWLCRDCDSSNFMLAGEYSDRWDCIFWKEVPP